MSEIPLKIIHALQRQGCGSCAQLATTVGVSRVTAHEVLKKLRKEGEVRVAGRESHGGRPGQVYEYSGGTGRRLGVILERRAAVIHVRVEQVEADGDGKLLGMWNYAALEAQSLEGCVAEVMRRGDKVRSIGLISKRTDVGKEGEKYSTHLASVFQCPSAFVGAAEALTREKEGMAGVYLGGEKSVPEGGMWHGGKWCRMGRLDWLPTPVSWQQLDYSDHTLVEEMVARLVQTISCIAAPQAIELHAAFWSSKLTQRIRFNVHSKLQGEDPPLRFNPVDAMAAGRAQRKAAWRVGDLAVGRPRGKSGGNQPVSRSHKD